MDILSDEENHAMETYLETLRSSTTRSGKPLSAGTLVGYANKFKQIYTDLKEDAFDPYELEVWVSNPERAYKPSTVVQYADVVCKVATIHAPESLDELENMRTIYVDIKNNKENEERQWMVKDALLAKFEQISYIDLLGKIVRQAEEELVEHERVSSSAAKRNAKNVPHQTQAARLRVILICVLLGANAPMRSDYRNIVIANRIDPIPPKTPYYEDGWIYTPPGSRLKDSDGLKDSVEKIDVRGAQNLIETLICYHESDLLFGIPYDTSSFSRLLHTQTKRTKGVYTALGIRFFRTKFSVEDDKVDAAYNVLAIMGHGMGTHRAAYSGRGRALESVANNVVENEEVVAGDSVDDPFIEETAAGFGGAELEEEYTVGDVEVGDVDEEDVEDNHNAKRQKIETVPITLRLA